MVYELWLACSASARRLLLASTTRVFLKLPFTLLLPPVFSAGGKACPVSKACSSTFIGAARFSRPQGVFKGLLVLARSVRPQSLPCDIFGLIAYCPRYHNLRVTLVQEYNLDVAWFAQQPRSIAKPGFISFQASPFSQLHEQMQVVTCKLGISILEDTWELFRAPPSRIVP